MHKYYKNIVNFIKGKIEEKYPEAKSNEKGLEENDKPSYLLWMMNHMQTFDDSKKAARWIGWIIAHAEILGFMDNTKSRELTRQDVKEGFE